MITLISICDLFWLFWLLPFLLGALLWWMGNSKYNKMVAEYDGKIKGLNGKISGLEEDLSACSSKRADLEGDLALTKGRMREMESDMNNLKAEAKDSAKKYADLKAKSDKGSHSSSLTSDKGTSGGGSSKSSGGSSSGSSNKGSGNDNASKKSTDSGSNDGGNTSGSNLGSSSTGSDISSSLTSDGGSDSIKGAAGDLGVSALSASGAGAAGLTGDSGDSSTSNTSGGASASGSSSGGNKKSIYSGIKEDNLQIIEGIGPKMESILKENGIGTFSALAGKSTSEVQAVLDKYGDKYKIIDPLTWSQQAGYAANGDYEGLIDLQKKLDTGKDNAVGKTDSKLEKYLIKTGAIKSFKQDDLKAIEGIGPATEKLLHSNGIMTWRDLANTQASDVKAMLTAAGSRFALGDPTTWPKQAELAADGKFDELREYQDFLDGGRG